MTSLDGQPFDDERAFLESIQNHLVEQLESGSKSIEINLHGIVDLPQSLIPPMQTAVDVVDGLGATLCYRCSLDLVQLLKTAGLPYKVDEGAFG